MRVDWCVSSWFRIKNTHSLTHTYAELLICVQLIEFAGIVDIELTQTALEKLTCPCLLRQQLRSSRYCEKNFVREPRGKTPPHRASVARHGRLHVAAGRESGERRRRESGQCVPRQAAASPPASRRHGSHAHPGGVTRRHPAPDCNARPGCDQSSLSLLLLPLRHPPRPRAPQVVYGATLLGHDAVATQAQSSPPPLKPTPTGADYPQQR